MRRLAASGMIVIAETQTRVLHQSPEFTAASDPDFDQPARADELRAQAEKALRMATVLAGGGFSDEALPLIAKAIGAGAAARLAARGELGAGALLATPAQVHDLVARGAMAPQAEIALSALWSSARGHSVPDIQSVIAMAALAISRDSSEQRAQAA
jgi:hypothetical protein